LLTHAFLFSEPEDKVGDSGQISPAQFQVPGTLLSQPVAAPRGGREVLV
jgi:hypothetical protein